MRRFGDGYRLKKQIQPTQSCSWVRNDRVELLTLTDDYSFETFKERHGSGGLPLFLISESGEVEVFSQDSVFSPRSGKVLVALIGAPEA